MQLYLGVRLVDDNYRVARPGKRVKRTATDKGEATSLFRDRDDPAVGELDAESLSGPNPLVASTSIGAIATTTRVH